MKNISFELINEVLASLSNGQISIEPNIDPEIGVKCFGFKDFDGVTRKLLVKDKPVVVENISTPSGNTELNISAGARSNVKIDDGSLNITDFEISTVPFTNQSTQTLSFMHDKDGPDERRGTQILSTTGDNDINENSIALKLFNKNESLAGRLRLSKNASVSNDLVVLHLDADSFQCDAFIELKSINIATDALPTSFFGTMFYVDTIDKPTNPTITEVGTYIAEPGGYYRVNTGFRRFQEYTGVEIEAIAQYILPTGMCIYITDITGSSFTKTGLWVNKSTTSTPNWVYLPDESSKLNGTYTTNFINILNYDDSVGAYTLNYTFDSDTNIGKIFGSVDITGLAAGPIKFEIGIPVASNGLARGDGAGYMSNPEQGNFMTVYGHGSIPTLVAEGYVEDTNTKVMTLEATFKRNIY